MKIGLQLYAIFLLNNQRIKLEWRDCDEKTYAIVNRYDDVYFFSACGTSAKADPIVLPATEDIISISVSDDNATATCTDEEQIGEILSILKDMESTLKSSVNESPDVNEYVKIDFHCSDDTVTMIFFYEDSGTQYVEQPYQGIYIPAPALNTIISGLLSEADS